VGNSKFKIITVDLDNMQVGYDAMAAVLLLYYEIGRDGGFSHDQTICLTGNSFNGFDYLLIDVDESLDNEIDELLIRQGALIYLLCDLHDEINEHEDDFIFQGRSTKIINRIRAIEGRKKYTTMPELESLFELICDTEGAFEYSAFMNILEAVYTKYVVSRFSIFCR